MLQLSLARFCFFIVVILSVLFCLCIYDLIPSGFSFSSRNLNGFEIEWMLRICELV